MESIPQGSLNENKVAVTVYINPGEQVGVTKIAKKKPNYFMVGNGTMNKNRVYSVDLLRELANSTKAEQYLLLAIKDGINYENGYAPIVKVIGDTSTAKQYIKNGYKSLYERNLVVRVKKSHYMINPNALVPLDYEEAMEIWEQAINKSKDEE